MKEKVKKKKVLLSDFDEECFNDADVAFGENNQVFIFVIISYITYVVCSEKS